MAKTEKPIYCQWCGDGNAWSFLRGSVKLCAVCMEQLMSEYDNLKEDAE